jgi:tripartite-type tricarboxylate transporter receptor subunit TctC
MTTRKFSGALLACIAALLFAQQGHAQQGQAQDFPSKPIRLINPFPPGGTIDRLARLIGARLTERWGQPVLVESRPGAAGNIAYGSVAAAAPDGYTMLIAANGLAANPSLYKKVSYDTLRDFAPVTVICSHPAILATHPSIPVQSLQELVAWSKANPSKASIASSGTGTSHHLAAELFKSKTGANLVHVPYKGSGPALTDLIGGQVASMFIDLPLALPHVKAGRLRAIGVSSLKRSPAAPDLPTVAESGVPGFDTYSWFGLLLPARTPKDIIDKTAQEVITFLKLPQTRDQLTALGEDVVASTPEEFAAYLKSEVAVTAQIIKASGASVE